MYKNYFFLNRFILELNTLLTGASLREVYSQEKDKLIFSFHKNEENLNLLTSVSQNLPFIQVRNDFHRARKNTIDFFTGYLPSVLHSISIADRDRIIKFNFDSFNLYFFIRGKNSNVVLIDDKNNLLSFKKITSEENALTNELNQQKYFTDYHIPDFSEYDKNIISVQNIQNTFPYIGKEIKKELEFRISPNNPEDILRQLKNILEEIKDNKIVVFYDEFLNRFILTVDSFRSFNYNNREEFNTYLEAINYYLVQKYKNERVFNFKKLISKNLDQQLDRISGKLNEISQKLNEPSKEEQYRHFGNLLLTYKNLIKKGMKEIEVVDFIDNEKEVKIKLDETLDSKKNIERYFDKAKNEKQSMLALSDLFTTLNNKYKNLIQLKNQFESAQNLEDYLNIMDKMKIKPEQSQSSKKEYTPNFKHYIIENKYHVFVGKDSQNNDELTTRFAKQNDYWFHARGVPGSHTVLRVDNTKEVVPKPILKKAAAIAAYHSKAKTSKLAPVAYTLKKYVTKRKGMEPGKVSLLKEEVLLVKPEIPDNCEYISTE